MKVTKSQLKRIIKEELEKTLNEAERTKFDWQKGHSEAFNIESTVKKYLPETVNPDALTKAVHPAADKATASLLDPHGRRRLAKIGEMIQVKKMTPRDAADVVKNFEALKNYLDSVERPKKSWNPFSDQDPGDILKYNEYMGILALVADRISDMEDQAAGPQEPSRVPGVRFE